ncbi:MAG: YIP1 family protein, partial [Bacillota bacterium]
RQAAENPPFSQALGVFIIVNILSTIVTTVSLGTALSSRIFASAPAGFIVGGLVLGFLDWFVVTAIFNFLAELFGGRGRGFALFTLVALANLPRLVNVPLALLSLTPASNLGRLLNLVVFIWVAILYVIAISEVYHLNNGRAVEVLLLPLGAVIIALVTFLIAFAGVIAKLIPLFEKGSPLLPGF